MVLNEPRQAARVRRARLTAARLRSSRSTSCSMVSVGPSSPPRTRAGAIPGAPRSTAGTGRGRQRASGAAPAAELEYQVGAGDRTGPRARQARGSLASAAGEDRAVADRRLLE